MFLDNLGGLVMKEKKRTLCVRNEEYGTLDLWINNEEHWKFGKDDKLTWQIIVTYNGESPEKGEAYRITLDEHPTKALDELMGYIGRDVENWYYKDIVLHWGVHTWKFYNSKNITAIEKDEYTQTLEDIQMYYDVEW